MNKKNIVEYLMNVKGCYKEEDQIMKAIEDTKIELDCARSIFDNVSDPKLIEMAIYAEEVAKKRYEYLLTIAKKKNIKVSNEYVLDKCLRVVQ